MPFFYQEQLDFDWLDSALACIVNIQETNLKRSTVRNVSQEIVTICRTKRERVKQAERLLDKYSECILYEEKQEIFRLIAETLLYIQYRGVLIKCTSDPKKLIESSIF